MITTTLLAEANLGKFQHRQILPRDFVSDRKRMVQAEDGGLESNELRFTKRACLIEKRWLSNGRRTHNWTVPTIFEEDGYRFFFYSNDHRPIHVHVRYGGGEAVFNVQDAVELRESFGFKTGELARAQELAEARRQLIVDKWHEHLG